MLIQQLLNGLTMGSIYALLAVGVSMIYKAMGMMNFAHGDTIMISAYIALSLYMTSMPLPLAIIFTIAIAALLGLALERFVYRKLEFNVFHNLLIATVGVSFVMRNLSIVIWGPESRSFPSLFSTIPWDINGLLILPQNVYIILIALCLVVLLQLFFYKTRSGKRMRAAASDSEAAAFMGINISLTRFMTFGMSAGFAAIAGILLAPIFYVSSNLGTMVGLKAFSAAILGGFGNIVGGLFGGLLLGLIEAIGATYISTAYRDVISFGVLFIILYFKPTGLFAKRIEQKL